MLHHDPCRIWTIEVSDEAEFLGDEHEVFWRSTSRLDKPCDLFTIASAQHPDDALVQLMLFEDGSIQAWSWMPTMIQTSPEEKRIVVGLLRPEHCPRPSVQSSVALPPLAS